METQYDSTADTLVHIKRVSQLLTEAATELLHRGTIHDDSKLKAPEKQLFDELTLLLEKMTYNSPEYLDSLARLKPALDHHYAKNSHHPQHYPDGVDGMNLFDIVEMFFDWKAASERHGNGNICHSITINRDRFKLSDQLTNIFKNTVKYMGW
jgi:hypothetical protein